MKKHKIQDLLVSKLSIRELNDPRCPRGLDLPWPGHAPQPSYQVTELLYTGGSYESRSLLEFIAESLDRVGLATDELPSAMREAFLHTSISACRDPENDDAPALRSEWITEKPNLKFEKQNAAYQVEETAYNASLQVYKDAALAYIATCEAERAAEQERKDREEYARLSAKFGKKGTKR